MSTTAVPAAYALSVMADKSLTEKLLLIIATEFAVLLFIMIILFLLAP